MSKFSVRTVLEALLQGAIKNLTVRCDILDINKKFHFRIFSWTHAWMDFEKKNFDHSFKIFL